MTIAYRTNIASLLAQRRLADASNDLGQSLLRISSGLRINTAADDAAGLALASSLNADKRIAGVAVRNANDGLSQISVTDAALGEISSILTRMAELAAQSSNGAYTTTQRSPLQAEFLALASEIQRIATTTEFNRRVLLSTGESISLQVGFNSYSASRIAIPGVKGTLESIQLASAGSSALLYSINGATDLEAQAAARTALIAVQAAIEEVDSRRGMLGATESRLNFAVKNLSSMRENFEVAESRIRDVDVAAETANLVSSQIKAEAASAILAQANLQPQLVQRLLSPGSDDK